MYLIISVLLPPAVRAVLDNGLQKVVVKDMAAMAAPAVLQPVDLTVTGADVIHQNVSLTATGGAGAVSGVGNESAHTSIMSDETGSNGGDGGRAEASITVSGQKYTAADVTLSATGGDGGNSNDITNGADGNRYVLTLRGMC